MSSLSKSAAKAMGCPQYFDAYFLSGVEQLKHGFTSSGTDFHAWISSYVNHLVDSAMESDQEWVSDWLSNNPVSADARDMIERESSYFSIDHESVLGTEVFASCDSGFSPLSLPFPGVGRAPIDCRSYVHGTLDLVQSLNGGHVLYVTDWKSGWSGKVDDFEAVLYAVLAFARYPRAERIRFRWMFVRAGAPVEVWYERSDLPRMHGIVRSKVAERDAAIERHASGAPSEVNPFAGLCGYCGLMCRLRTAASAGTAISAPLQAAYDAREAVGRIIALRPVLSHLEEALRSYLTTNGPLDNLASINLTAAAEVPLAAGLEAMGYKIDATEAKWDVPLENLRIGITDLKMYAKAKKRAGMAEAIDAVSIKTPKATMRLTPSSVGDISDSHAPTDSAAVGPVPGRPG